MIKTDQKSLVHLEDQRLNTPWQQKAFTKLLGLQYRLCYKKGSENNAFDALSRQHSTTAQSTHQQELQAISVAQPAWMEEVITGYAQDSKAQQLITQLAIGPVANGQFTLQQGILRFRGRVWLGNNKSQQHIMQALHDSALGGHSGFPATYRRIKHLFAWPGMKQIKTYVQTCQICQQAKPERVKYPGLLHPLPVAKRCRDMASLDFIEGLPTSGRFSCILVVVDTFSKYAHFIALAHPYTAHQIAQLYLDQIYKLHGMPESLVSDRDPIFTSHVWKELFKLQKVELRMSTAHHPQSDGQTERVNQCLETYLRCFVHSCPKTWSKWLPLAEFWYNSSFHSTLGKTPFQVVYGQEPRQLGILPANGTPITELNEWLEER